LHRAAEEAVVGRLASDANSRTAKASETGVRTRLRSSDVGSDLLLLSWGETDGRSPEAAAEEAYAAIDEACRSRESAPLQERIFGDLSAAPAIARGRARALGASPLWSVPPTFVEGSPVARGGLAGLNVIAARGASRLVADGETHLGRVVEGETARFLGLADVGRSAYAPGTGPAEDAALSIDAAEALLAREGFSFRDVARTWFYLRDILDWYGPFNDVRNAAFRRIGLIGPDGDGQVPASTGIEGRNARGGWCTLDLVALQTRAGGRPAMRRLHSRKQNEATDYGSAFARAIEVSLDDARYIFISGTASIDDHGETIHRGDFETQVRHTLEVLEALLEGAGAGLAHLAQATAFLKNPDDGRTFERILARAGLEEAPIVATVADVCRDDLLFEIDATAILPRRAASPSRRQSST
jgi:enamine deaminase RidA (YjgF/YER057c/UK114 family)